MPQRLLMREEVPSLAYPEDERRTDDDDDPIDEAQTYYVEELLNTGYLNHGYLTYENDCTGGEQSVTTFEVEGTSSCLECSRIEEVEEVGHDKGGKEKGEFVRCYFALRSKLEVEEVGEAMHVSMLEDVEHSYE